MKIFDNIGCSFSVNKNNEIVILGSLPGYTTLGESHKDITIPYLARNIDNKNIIFEVGTAQVQYIDGIITIVNRQVLTSSNADEPVDFNAPGNKEFYLFVNTANFNTAFNNISIQNTNFTINNQKTVYVVDVSSNFIVATLTSPALTPALEIEFRTVGNGTLAIKSDNNTFNLELSGNNRYTKIVSTGHDWMELKDNSENNFKVTNTDNAQTDFFTMAEPDGEQQSIQYRAGDNFAGGNLYYIQDELRFGTSPVANPKHSISTSGNVPVSFNQTRDGSNFIVYGTGNAPGYPEKNLYFSYDGRLGINMPSGIAGLVKPSTVFHIVNTLCKEGIRLETLTSCYPADITLYQNPIASTDSTVSSTVAQITLAGKSGGVKKNYAQIKGVVKDSTHGQINLEVDNNGISSTILSGNSDQVVIANDNYRSSLDINNSSAKLSVSGGGSLNVSSNSVGINAGSSTNTVNITGLVIANNGFKIPYVNQTNVLLSVDANKNIVPATGFQIPGIVADGKQKILTTLTDGTVVASRNVDSYWPYETGNSLGGKDLLWNRYPHRVADVCCVNTATRELSLLESVPLAEYDVDDQIAILNLTTNTTTYRRISRLNLLNDQIIGFTLDQDVTLSGVIRTYSVTKGGVLTNGIYTSGIVSDASNIILSTRPRTNTVFNSSKKDINFTVYATENSPAINVIANATIGSSNNGTYFKFATQLRSSDGTDIEPFTSKINSNGFGATNTNNSVNFNEAADIGIWPSRVTAFGTNGKPSYYGTYDQNGNVYEWVEDDIRQSSAATDQYICGGSWRTSNPKGLRGYIPTPRDSKLDDVGFRICSKAGFTDQEINTLLGLSFVRVDDIDNPADTTPIYTETSDNRFDLKAEPTETTVTNLGVVEYPYNISTNEITNTQYTVFLNSVATGSYPDALYDTQMSSDIVGGISRSGDGSVGNPYQYYVKEGMNNMPATFITYLSALRFVNWITNGAPSGAAFNSASIEFGSYSIVGNELSITKNRDQDYWIPTLNEWHKAAYYMPINERKTNSASAVTIKASAPHEYVSGQMSSLTVGGHLYADNLKIGKDNEQLISTMTSGGYFNILLGPDQAVIDTNVDTGAESSYRSYISNTGMQFATTGNISFINKINPISKVILTPDGMLISSKITIANINSDGSVGSGVVLTPSGTENLDSNGDIVSGGAFPGINGGFAFKELTGNNLRTSDKLVVATFDSTDASGVTTTEYYPQLVGTNANEIIHNNDNGYLSSSNWLTVGEAPPLAENMGSKVLSLYSDETGVLTPAIYTSRIFVGPPLAGYSGSLLTHNGTSPATWEPNTFLKAPGVSWTRYKNRAVEFLNNTSLQFISLSADQGGTGGVSVGDIETEFAYNETIALVNQAREVFYVKVSTVALVDSRGDLNKDLFINQSNRQNLIINVCPPVPQSFIDASALDLGTGNENNGKLVGYAFSVQKGAYLDMEFDQTAVSGFTCDGLDSASEYRFKPTTANTLSIRPDVHTAFNKRAENIDFIVYGHRKTLFTRYEPEWFDLDSYGTPVGLTPAFRIHSHIDNSTKGSLESGIFRRTESATIATGILPDLTPKITVNMSEPYKITTFSGMKYGVILPGLTDLENLALEKEYGIEISSTGVIVSGTNDLTTYADLSINGITYSSGIIAQDIVLGPVSTGSITYEQSLQQKIYAPNYPLTINNLGQIVSLIPPPNPTVPDPAVNLTVAPRNGAILLNWNAPTNDGGKPITAYIIEYSTNLGDSWTYFDQLDTNGLPVNKDPNTIRTIDNLVNGVSYIFRVYAINSVGIGISSNSSPSATPAILSPTAPRYPSTPTNFIEGQDPDTSNPDQSSVGSYRPSENVKLTWLPPLSTGQDATISEYIIEYAIDDGINSLSNISWSPSIPVISPNTSTTIPGINLKFTYYFRVSAKNSNNITGSSIIFRSIGTDGDPRGQGSNPSVPTNQYDFGTIVFTGSCS